MKKILFILLIFFTTSFAQTRFLSFSGTTGTSVDTLNFDFYCWEIMVINDNNISDTLFVWTEAVPSSKSKIALLGGEFINLRFTAGINRLYLKASTSGVKRRVIAKP